MQRACKIVMNETTTCTKLFLFYLQVVNLVADRILEHRVSSLVVDPVLVSTSGHSLGDSDVAHALVER